MTVSIGIPTAVDVHKVSFLELELTRSCWAKCVHCYSNSGSAGGTGVMTSADWMSVIEQAAHPHGVETVQFIGGDPVLHPTFVELADFALLNGLQVAVFTSLYGQVSERLWNLYARERVKLSVSWYSADPDEHDTITRTPGSWHSTWANLREARRRGITIKAGMVEVLDDQDLQGGAMMLGSIGITNITHDRARPVGRAAPRNHTPSVNHLCGKCGRGRAAIDTSGRLMPCVLGRHLSAGNVRETPLEELLASAAWEQIVMSIPAQGMCGPADSNDCDPAI